MTSTRPLHNNAASPGTTTAMSNKPVRHFNQVELSRRWSVSPRTLERWRWLKQGPEYIKIGGRVVYTLEAVEQFESARRRFPNTTVGKAA
jgi:hypothetical protein